MAAIAVGEGVDPDELMVKASGEFVGCKGVGGDLVLRVVEQIAQACGDLRPFNADVFVAVAKLAGPLPCFIKHAAMELAHEVFLKQLAFAGFDLAQEPALAFEDVGFFPDVEIGLGVNVAGNEALGFVGVERGGAWNGGAVLHASLACVAANLWPTACGAGHSAALE